MGKQLIEQIEGKLASAEGLNAKSREELLAMLADLKHEIEGVSSEHAESIASFAGVATHEATRSPQNPALLQDAIDGLSESVKELETDHPRTVEIVNGICTMLSNLGI
jgi:hypothetical protein